MTTDPDSESNLSPVESELALVLEIINKLILLYYHCCIVNAVSLLVILYLTGLNYYGLLKPFYSPYIDVYVFAMRFYILSGRKK